MMRPVGIRFGLLSGAMNLFDYNQYGQSPVTQNKLIYSACIVSRIIKARSNNERMENTVRGMFDWWFWFQGSALAQAAVTNFLLSPKYKAIILNNASPTLGWREWTKRILLDPFKIWRVASMDQISQRWSQIRKQMIAASTNPQQLAVDLAALDKRFVTAKTIRGVIKFFGLMNVLFGLGILTPLVMIAVTKARVAREKSQGQGASPMITPQQSVAFRGGVMLPSSQAAWRA